MDDLRTNKKSSRYFSFISLPFIIIMIILQIISLIYGKSSKNINDLINNWKYIPLQDLSTSYEHKNFKKKDYIEINSIKIYYKRMNEKYNYFYLKQLEKQLTEKQDCGKDDLGNSIYFPPYESCPINYIELKEECSSNKNCIKISSNYYLEYSNENINNNLIVHLNYSDNTINSEIYKGISLNITKKSEIILNFKNNIQPFNILIIFFLLMLIILYVCIIVYPIIIDNFYYFLIFFCYFYCLIIFSSYIIYDIIESNKILKKLEINELIVPKSIYIINLINLIFSILFIISYLLSYFIFYKEKKIECSKQFILMFIKYLIPVCSFILLIFVGSCFKKYILKEGVYKDLFLNYKMSPIESINIKEINENMNELNYFDKEKPYTLGKIQLRTDKKIEYLTNWKDKTFYISRMNKKYTYPNILNNEKKGKYCGYDSNGNKLYFPLNVECPINYIEFTQSKSPSLKEYNFKTFQINQNTYMHYTNEYLEGKILIDLRISNLKPFGDIESDNNICYEIYGKEECIIDNNYHGYNNDVYGYEQIDSDLINSKSLYLYSRTYVGINDVSKKLGNYNDKINNYYLIIRVICFLISFIYLVLRIGFYIFYEIKKRNNIPQDYYSVLYTISLILTFINYLLYYSLVSKNFVIKNNIIYNSKTDLKDFYDNDNFTTDHYIFSFLVVILIIYFILCFPFIINNLEKKFNKNIYEFFESRRNDFIKKIEDLDNEINENFEQLNNEKNEKEKIIKINEFFMNEIELLKYKISDLNNENISLNKKLFNLNNNNENNNNNNNNDLKSLYRRKELLTNKYNILNNDLGIKQKELIAIRRAIEEQ